MYKAGIEQNLYKIRDAKVTNIDYNTVDTFYIIFRWKEFGHEIILCTMKKIGRNILNKFKINGFFTAIA